jgi:chlorite dismutase
MSTIFNFIGDSQGQWKVINMSTVTGDLLESVSSITVLPGNLADKLGGVWSLKGVISNLRYTEKQEKDKLVAVQEGLGRTASTCAAMIPIKKSQRWWDLAQDERREIFERQSAHTQTGLKYLPAIARRLYHCRDINEPFDFITWFEYSPSYSSFFEELVSSLRETEEWKFVEREVDIRMTASEIGTKTVS